jgi:hypothetical protein
VYLLRVFFYPQRRHGLGFFANPSQVLRKFAKKAKGGLREVAKKLRRKMNLNPALFTLSLLQVRSRIVFRLPVGYLFITKRLPIYYPCSFGKG